jgi:hypothetical protein
MDSLTRGRGFWLQLFSPSRIPPPNLIPAEHFAQEALTTAQSYADIVLPQVGATIANWAVPGLVRLISDLMNLGEGEVGWVPLVRMVVIVIFIMLRGKTGGSQWLLV